MKNAEKKFVRLPLEDFRRACTIVAEMDALVKEHVQDGMNMLLMSSTYENLGAAAGILSAYLPDGGAGLAVVQESTRQSLRTAYAHLNAVLPNTKDGSAAQNACLQLQACLFTGLNTRYVNGKIQESVENVMSAAACGLRIVNGLIEAGPEGLDPDYLSDAGQKLDLARMELVRDVLASLVPVQDAAQDGATEGGGQA